MDWRITRAAGIKETQSFLKIRLRQVCSSTWAAAVCWGRLNVISESFHLILINETNCMWCLVKTPPLPPPLSTSKILASDDLWLTPRESWGNYWISCVGAFSSACMLPTFWTKLRAFRQIAKSTRTFLHRRNGWNARVHLLSNGYSYK